MRHGIEEQESGEELVCLLDDEEERMVERQSEGWGEGRLQTPHPSDANPSSSNLASHSRRTGGGSWHERGERERDMQTVDWSFERTGRRAHAGRVRCMTGKWPAVLRVLYEGWDRGLGWLVLCAVGVSSGVVCSLVDIGADWATDLKLGRCQRGWWMSRAACCIDSRDLAGCPDWAAWAGGHGVVALGAYAVLGTGMAGLAAWLTRELAEDAQGSGIAEIKVILGGCVMRRFLRPWTLVVKAMGVILSVGSGLSIGKEGPMIHISACIGSLWSRLFAKFRSSEASQRELLSSAAAAGMGVAFGAPIGGVLFSLEEASTYFPPRTMWKAFFCATAGVATVQYFHRLPVSGKLALFEVHFHSQWKWFEMPAFAIVGAIGGILGSLLIRLTLFFTSLRKTSFLQQHPVYETVTLCILTCALHWNISLLRGGTNGLIASLLSDCSLDQGTEQSVLCAGGGDSSAGVITLSDALTSLVFAGLVKFFLTSLTATARVPGGTLVPSLAIGALLGRAAGLWVESLHKSQGDSGMFGACVNVSKCVTPGVYAMVGAAAVLGGVTRMTVSVVVIILELTGGLEYVLPLMVAVMVSKLVGDACGTESLYDEMVMMHGYPYLDTKNEAPTTDLLAGDIMTQTPLDCVALNDTTLSSIEALLVCSQFQGFPVVTTVQEMQVSGFVSRAALSGALLEVQNSRGGRDSPIDIWGVTDTAPLQITPTTQVDRVWELFSLLGLRYVLVCKQGRLIGIIKKKDLLSRMNQARPSKHWH